MKAIFSTHNKDGILEFAKILNDLGIELVSTGGTRASLTESGLNVTPVSDLTGFPEILDGRVKTLHPKIHGGILARRNLVSHMEELDNHHIEPIGIVVINLYPFVKTVTENNATLDDALENIDIGGPTMIRAAAKNFPSVLVLVDPNDYEWVGRKLTENGGDANKISIDERRGLARKAFQHVALYDTAITQYLGRGNNLLSEEFTLGFSKSNTLRYGENPHQEAALYIDQLSSGGIVRPQQLHGIEMSYNNILDADAAWRTVSDLPKPGACIVKHTNPCGIAIHEDQPTAYRNALEGDPTSAYGGIVSFNSAITAATAEAMRGILFDIILAPDIDDEALDILKKRKRTRILRVKDSRGPMEIVQLRKVSGGALIQLDDIKIADTSSWELKSDRSPTETEMQDLSFAWMAIKHIKSNAIALAKDNMLVGMGAGQPNRVTSVHLALNIAGAKAHGSALASDAFFPFGDSIEMAAKGGVSAVVEPGGSIRDDEVIEAANRTGIALLFTGNRHFKH